MRYASDDLDHVWPDPSDDDGFYSRPVGFDWCDIRVRVAAWLVSAALGAALLGLLISAAGAQTIPSVPATGPQAREVQLGMIFSGDVLHANLADAVVRQQDLAYLERVVASKKPNVPPIVVGTIVGKAMNPSCTGGVYIAGWVVESAARVQARFDASTIYHEATVTPTLPGYAKSWTLCVPILYHDGKEHGIYARALRATGTVIGPIDNAKSATRWKFTIPADPPVVVPPPTDAPIPQPPPPASWTNGRAYYSGGVVTVDAAPRFTKVELLIDGRTVEPWYRGVQTFVNQKATFDIPLAARDGAEHLLDVRLYEPAMDAVHRPDGYPIRATLTP